MEQTNEIYKIVLEKIQQNGVELINNVPNRIRNIAQQVRIKQTQLVLSYEYTVWDNNAVHLERMTVGYINPVTGKYKSVNGFYEEQQQVLLDHILKLVKVEKQKTSELDLIRKLAANEYVHRKKK